MNTCSAGNSGALRGPYSPRAVGIAGGGAYCDVLATKYAEAQDSQTIALGAAEVGFGAVTLDADTQSRTVTITNNGDTRLTFGGMDSGTLETVTFTTSLDTERLVPGAGETGTFQIFFDPVTSGYEEVTGTLLGASGVTIEGATQVVVSGTGVTTQPSAQPGATARSLGPEGARS